MKRIVLHISFWVAYIFFLTVTDFVWVKAEFPQWDNTRIFMQAFIAGIIIFIPYALFACYFSYYAFNKLTSKNGKTVLYLLEITGVFIFFLVVIRIASYHIIARHVYQVPVPSYPFSITKILSTVIYMVFCTGSMMIVKSVRNQLAAKERENMLIKQKMDSELKFLRNQLNPHFLFNTLNNIYALSRKKSDRTPEAVMKLSELLSFMLYESGKETIPLKKEVELIEDFLTLEKMRYADTVKITFKKDADDLQQPIAPLLLLPFVENAFKHGLSQKPDNPYISILVQLKRQQLFFSVENSFFPIEEQDKKSGNIGLANSRRLIELTYAKQKLITQSINNIYSVQLSIDLNSYGKT